MSWFFMTHCIFFSTSADHTALKSSLNTYPKFGRKTLKRCRQPGQILLRSLRCNQDLHGDEQKLNDSKKGLIHDIIHSFLRKHPKKDRAFATSTSFETNSKHPGYFGCLRVKHYVMNIMNKILKDVKMLLTWSIVGFHNFVRHCYLHNHFHHHKWKTFVYSCRSSTGNYLKVSDNKSKLFEVEISPGEVFPF